MATLSLKISIDDGRVVKTIQFDPSTSVYDACRVIRDKILEANLGEPKDYGLFLHSEEDTKVGVWLEPARSLEYYILRNGDIVEYKKKLRTLRVRMLDGSVKTLLVDDSQNVANLMVVICTKIGITNYDEYSLVRDDATKDELDHSMDGRGNYGTLTLKRRHQAQEKERDAKMDQLRKKLRTDDEVNWVDPAKTLREQGVEESETLLLRRKFFFSDRNVDGSDPVQLGLLYVQARDAIVDGMHPVTMDKACEFAGIQCQIQFGDHKEEKHTIGLLDLKEFLPASYAKVKGVEKKVFREHKKHQGLTELDAKVLYTKTARDLKTYGVAFFLVKEKMKGKNKLVPRLLGVTKDSVLRLDEKTKEILQTWPLTTVRRWCASPNTFTLDFGDYSDQYYSVQTTEAEQILQVIAGYIDIILKKQRAKEHFGIEGDEGSTMVEDSVSPLKATILQHDTPAKVGKVNTESLAKPAVMRAGADGVKPYSTGYMAGAQYTMISGQVNVGHTPPTASQVQQTKITTVTTEPQRALLSTISSGQEIIKRTEREITRAVIPEVGNDAASIKWKEVQLDTNKQVVTSHIAAMNAATAQVVTLTSGSTEEVDHTAVGAAITTITTNLPEMTKGVKMIAALLEDNDNGDKLLEATRKLCNAFSDLLKAAEPETKEPRQSLLNAASRVGEASTQVLYTISEDAEENKEIQDILLALAKAVANTTAALVLKAKGVAASCGADQQAQNRVIAAATQCALATSQLVACAKVVAPTLDNAACRKQISAAAAAVAKAVESLLAECCNTSSSGSAGDELRAAASDVSHALSDMLRHVDSQGNMERQRAVRTIQETTTVETVMTATDELVASEGDSTQMVKQARLLGQATAKLIQDIKTEAETRPLPEDAQRRLLRAARRLADATAKLVEAARACASAPEDIERRKYLRAAAIDVREAAEEYVRPRPAEPHAHLQQAARQAASAANQFATVANSASQHCTIRHVQETLYEETNALTLSVPPLLEAVKVSSARPSDVAAHLDLIDSSETFLQSGTRAAAGARGALAALDSAESRRLTPVAKDLASASSDLRSAVSQARAAYEDRSLEAAATTLRSLQRQLDDTAKDHSQGTLVPLPGETAETSSTSLSMSARSTGAGISRLLEGARRGDAAYAGTAARDVARHTRHLVDSVRGVAATAESHDDGERVIDSAQGLLTYSVALIEVTHRYFINSETSEFSEVQSIAKNVTQSLNNTVNTLPSHRDVDTTIENINETLQILSMGEFPPTNKSYSELQLDLNTAAANLNTASTDVVTGIWSRKPLGDTAKNFGRAYEDLLTITMEMAGQTKDDENRTQMVESMRGVSLVSSKLLSTARSVNHDPGQPDAKNKLSSAARAVTDSINYLVDVCTSAAPGQKECDNAIRSIQSAKPLLQNPSEPINNLSYFSCVDAIIEHSKTLGDGMSGMASHAKNSEHEQFGQSVRIVADSVCGLVECTAQAAYLVGVSDEHSVVGRAGTVDAAQFARASQAIQQACSGLADPNTNQHQVLSAATVIARHTSALCNACRSASAAAPAASAKRHFVQAAKDVANSTATLVKEIKALDADYSQANRSRCANATVPLLEAVQGLCQFANSPEFAAIPAKISAQGRRSQMPILESGRNIISGSCSMIESAKCLAVQPGDRTQWQNLAQHSRTLSDSIKSLVNNIRDKAPGQQECIHTIEILNSLLRQVDQTSLLAVSQSLQPRGDNTLEGYTEHLESAATEMLERLEPLRAAAKNEAENLGHTVTQLATYANSLVSASEGAASLVMESRAQSSLLDCTKTVLEGSVQLVAAAKNAGGNPNATASHSDVDNECIGVRSALTELLNNCEEVSAQRGLVSGLVDNVTRAMERVTDHRMSLIGSYNESDSFVDYQTRMVGAAKEIARIATDMTAKSSSDPSRLTQLGGDAGHRYAQLAQDAVGAAATTANADIAQRIRSAVVELGAALVELVRAGGMCQLGRDERARNDVIETARHVTEKVGGVLAALQAGSKGTQACIDAVSTVSAIISDLDTTILFASAGTLHAEKDSDSFSDHREAILKTAKSLVEDTKTLVGGAAGSQEQLAEAARDAVKTIVQLSEVVKLGAMSLGSGNPDSQVMLIHAVRDVAAALRDLIQATKDASGKHIGDPAMTRLKDSAKALRGIASREVTDDAKKRWSLPSRKPIPKPRRPSSTAFDNRGYDSETDWFISDQEDELIRLLEYSSQEDEFTASTTSLNYVGDMEFKVMLYGQRIVVTEINRLVDVVENLHGQCDNKRKREALLRQKAKLDLNVEMRSVEEFLHEDPPKPHKPLPKLNFHVRKVRPIRLNVLDASHDRSKQMKIMINDEAEMWKALAIRNVQKNIETKRDLDRFGSELELGNVDFKSENKALKKFIRTVETRKSFDMTEFEGVILKLIAFAKRDFVYRGFDPLIARLKQLASAANETSHSHLSYEELCRVEKRYEEIIRVYERMKNNKITHDKRTKRPSYDLNTTYPLEYYANNWWQIYEDVLKTRATQFGSVDNWWKFYEDTISGENKENQNSVMVTNVTSLLKTVKAVEDEHTRGTRALEATIEAIAQEVKLLMSHSAPKLTATPEELVRCTKAITVATAKAVAAGNSSKQDDIIAVANIGRKAIGDMLAICKGAAHSCAETHELRERALRAGADTAHAYRDLLQAIHQGVSGGGQAAKAQYPELSRRVAQCAAEIVAVAETLRGSDWVDPDDPTVIAENELLGAAASIDAAANKLAALRPRKSVKEADENLNFDEMILEAAKSIIAATSALVRAASAAQRELIDQGIVARRPLTSSDDGQWSEGLISAARLVAAAAHSLVEAANALVQGCGSEERLVGCAKQVAGTTAQLLVACKVKADPNSETTRRLQAAGAAVIRSTDNLVSAARQAISLEEERCLVLNRRMVGGIAQEIDARSEVLRIERQLEEARGRLTAIRQAKYKLKTGDTSGDETDNEITLHSTGHSYNASPSPFSINSTRQDGGYSSESPTRFAAGYLPSSTLNQSADSPLKQSTRFNQSSESYNQSSSLRQMPSTFTSSQTDPNFGQSSLRQTTSSFSNQSQHTQSNGVHSDYGQTMYIQQAKSPLSPPLPPPPPPILSSFSSFGRPASASASAIASPAKPLNYEGFTTRYETRSYDTPRPLGLENYRSENVNQYNTFKEERISSADGPTAPMSPRFNARFDLNTSTPYKTSFGPGTGQTFSQTQKSKENIPGGVRTSELTVKSESYQSQPFFSSEHRVESTGSTSAPRPSKIPTPTREIVARIAPPHSVPNYSEESSTEVRDVPNGTQKITTTKIYSSSPMQITSTKFQDPADDLKPSFLQPSDFRQTISGKTSSDLTKELDAMESRLAKQTVSSEVLEKKTVMTTSSKSEVSRTTTQKFGEC